MGQGNVLTGVCHSVTDVPPGYTTSNGCTPLDVSSLEAPTPIAPTIPNQKYSTLHPHMGQPVGGIRSIGMHP